MTTSRETRGNQAWRIAREIGHNRAAGRGHKSRGSLRYSTARSNRGQHDDDESGLNDNGD